MRTAFIVAVGGGTVMDAGKVLAFKMASNDQGFGSESGAAADACDPLRMPYLVAVPTIAGSGAESTQFATVWTPSGKTSLEHPALRPSRILLVPALAQSVPADVAVASALDAFSHACEAIWNVNATAATDATSVMAIRKIVEALNRFSTSSNLVQITAQLMTGSMLAGSAIAETRTALSHSISYPLTSELRLPHAVASSFTLAEVARFNLATSRDRLVPIGAALGCAAENIPDFIVSFLKRSGVGKRLRVPTPIELRGVRASLIGSARAKNNIRSATESEAREIARVALEAFT